MFNYSSVKEIKKFLMAHDIAVLKRFGQNFMVHEPTRRRFVHLLPLISTEDGGDVWEIGPGIGALSVLLLERGMTVRAYEIDRGFVACLRELFANEIQASRFSIIEGDAGLTLFEQPDSPAAIIGNLPYNVAALLITRLITRGFSTVPMVFTFQKEVVERICAQPGDRAYSSLSILCQFAMDVEHCGTIPPASFFPIPHVHSAIVRLEPAKIGNTSRQNQQSRQQAQQAQQQQSEQGWQSSHFTILENLLGLLFRSRRKTISNNIKQTLSREQATRLMNTLDVIGIDPGLRAEKLPVQAFRDMVMHLSCSEEEHGHAPFGS